MSSTRPPVRQIETGQPPMPDYHQSPSSSVSSLSGSDVVFSQPALAANRDNDLVIDLDTDDEYSSGIFAWPTVESPAAHHSSTLRPSHRALLLTGSSDAPSSRSVQSSNMASASGASTTPSERRRHALTIALNRETEQAADPSTSLARRIAARDSTRTSSSPSSQQEQSLPTARLLSRTTVAVAEPEPAADLRRLATTREAERQLQYRDWHRLGLLDPPNTTAGSDGAGITPGRMTPQLAYARRRSSAATTRVFPSASDNNEGQEDDIDVLSMDIAQRLRRRMALDALDPATDSQLERERGRDEDPSAPLPSVSSSIRSIDRRLGRFRSWLGRNPQWEDGRDDPNGENVYNEHGNLATPASRSRYWNALSNAATDDLLALAAERSSRPAPSHPPGLPTPTTPEQIPTPPKFISMPDPLPSPLGTMLLPTPRQRFTTAFHAS